MPYTDADRMPFEDCEQLKEEAEIFMHKKKLTFYQLSRRADVLPAQVEAWLKGKIERLPVVTYGRIWLATHPEKEGY